MRTQKPQRNDQMFYPPYIFTAFCQNKTNDAHRLRAKSVTVSAQCPIAFNFNQQPTPLANQRPVALNNAAHCWPRFHHEPLRKLVQQQPKTTADIVETRFWLCFSTYSGNISGFQNLSKVAECCFKVGKNSSQHFCLFGDI